MALKVPNHNSNKMTKHDIKRPLENRTFYLDLKMYPGEAKLCKNLKLLGAKQESFLSRDVSFVVSNRECLKNASAKPFKMPSKTQNWTPLTPITNTTCHSPLFNESSMDYLDSPPYTNSPASDQNSIPMSRGMAILKKAVLKKQTQFTTDLVEVCKQWNVKILHVDTVLAKVEKLKSQFIVHLAAEKQRMQNGERKLKPPFLKVEKGKRGWTWYREFPSLTFNNKLSDQVKELFNHFKKSGSIEVAYKPVLARNNISTKSPMTQSPAFPPSISKSFSKFSETTAKPSTAFSVCNGKRKMSEQPLVASKKQKTSQGRKKKLYCEICKVNFVNLDRHLDSDSHRLFMSDPKNFLEIQNIITSLPKIEDFLRNRSSLCTNFDHAWDMTNKVMNSFDNPQGNLQEYTPTCEVSVQTGSHFCPSQLLASNSVAPAVVGDVDTEPYSLLEENYVSPSCTSPESVYMPYLEDSTDDSFVKNKECINPLNLSKNEKDSKQNESFSNQLPQGFTQATCFNCLENSFGVGVAESSFKDAFEGGVNVNGGASTVLNEYSANDEVLPTLCNTNVIACQSDIKVEAECLNSIPIMKDSQCASLVEHDIIPKDEMKHVHVPSLAPSQIEDIIDTVTPVDLCTKETVSNTYPLLRDSNLTTNVECSEDVAAEPFPSSNININCISTMENQTVSASIENQSTDGAQLEGVNSKSTELYIKEQNSLSENETHIIQDKVQNTSNDSGICIQDSSPSLTCYSHKEDSADSLKGNECCALDLSATKENPLESICPAGDDVACTMPVLTPNVVDAVSLLCHPSDISVQSSDCMPVLIPTSHGNGCEATAVDITFDDTKGFETHVLHESECEAIKQNASPLSSAFCPNNCSPTKESPECESSAENPSPNICEPNITNQNSSGESRNARKVTFSQLCEEVSMSFNRIGDNLAPSSSTSCYELVEEADFDSSSTECEWEHIQSGVSNLCQSFCQEEEDADLCTLKTTCF